MQYIGVDLHKRFLVLAVESDGGAVGEPERFECRDAEAIRARFAELRPFRAVIESSCSYRWLYETLTPLGEVVLAHPLRMRAMAHRRAKTDKLDARLLASELRADRIPEAYAPPARYAELREMTRHRARLSRRRTEAMNELHALLARRNFHGRYKDPLCKKGRRLLRMTDLGPVDGRIRDEALARIEHYERELEVWDRALAERAPAFPEAGALRALPGVGPFISLLIVAEIGEPERFSNGRRVGAYAGLTARVSQSGEHAYYGHITRQGSPWLRWALVQAAMKASRADPALARLYERVRRRRGAKVARVAVARKLASICWARLRRFRREAAAREAA